MKTIVISALALTLGLAFAADAAPLRHRYHLPHRPAPRHAAIPQQSPHPFDVKPGTALIVPITIVDGKPVAGTPRLAPLAAAKPADGEIVVGLERQQGTLYNQITVAEKTAQPIDFLVTGLNGGTKIDETEICGRLDAPVQAHIGSVPWRFSVNSFEVGKGTGCGS